MKIKKNAPVLFERSVPDCTGRQTRTYDSRCAKDASHQVARQETGGRTRTPKSFVRYSGKMGRRTDRASERADRERGKKQYFDDEIRNDFRLRRRKSRNEPANEHEMERNTEQSGRAAGPLWDPN